MTSRTALVLGFAGGVAVSAAAVGFVVTTPLIWEWLPI